ncbi:bifunctional phosphatase PAP2/diacylglycerol kinase family protein [Streptomyces neyagawaensis]|uniref:bifunctional phosphatase PAP2/diacylglycerol kinase family protein n=1 Tax=Streptomyces neyagawaensis TaxID=42238 RepID=UPI00201CC6F0|nr:bifunctional phosphatase PAP2/diacylglycerol kinase family protein [Streptomyces neyagawaensis]MCL6732037.1 phosphatase PAP2 family protein [Streptomyces neyagawaensis]MDE1682469.1 phosphatase PAP2 family protein [Streptomyces neyagawaensis]
MTADVDLTVRPPGHHILRDRFLAADSRLFNAVATRDWPGAHPMLPRLSRAANHGVLWFATAAVIAATRSPRARRAAARGVASLALASATINTLGKRTVRRPRPVLDNVPVMRQLKRQPITTSFPSGHSASAAAFATGVALESRGWGAVVAPLATAVALSRVYTGVHFPSDVLAGAAFGVGAAYAVRGMVPTRDQLAPPGRPRADAPALPDGEGLVMVANTASGTADRVRALRDALPGAQTVECEPEDLRAELEKAATHARVLGVCGGDGTVNAAAEVALRHGLPLAVLPGGTFNHFAQDLGVEDVRDLGRALRRGEAVRVDVGHFRSGETEGHFVNTFSVGVYPELVRERERWERIFGGWPAGVIAAVRVLRSDRHPLQATFQGRPRPIWLLFAGNGTYHRLGLAPGHRFDLADGLFDVRVVHGGRRPALRLLAAALAGPLTRSPAHAAVRVNRLRIEGVTPGTPLAYDGEVTEVHGDLTLQKLPEALTVYRPLG